MSKAEHTPGPWEAQKSKMPDNTGGYDWCVTDEHRAIIAEVFQNVGYAKDETDYPYDQRPVEANARLISAAPEMLGILERILENKEDPSKMVVDIMTAIAKATGGTK